MADVISAVRSYILSQSSVTDVIGQRMYFDRLKQKATLPAATISRVSETHAHTISNRSGLVWDRLQIDCYSLNRLTTASLAETIYKCGIVAFKGTTGSVNIRGVDVEDGRRDYTIDDAKGGDDHIYATQFDLRVCYLES